MTTRIFITKYALTQGIYAKTCEIVDDTMVKVSTNAWNEYYHKPDWHFNKAEAIRQALEMKRKKIVSLQKSLKKFDKLTFDEVKEL